MNQPLVLDSPDQFVYTYIQFLTAADHTVQQAIQHKELTQQVAQLVEQKKSLMADMSALRQTHATGQPLPAHLLDLLDEKIKKSGQLVDGLKRLLNQVRHDRAAR